MSCITNQPRLVNTAYAQQKLYLACIVALSEQQIFRLQIIATPVATIVIHNRVQVDLGNKSSSDVVRDGVNYLTARDSVVANNCTSDTLNLVTPAKRSLLSFNVHTAFFCCNAAGNSKDAAF